MFIEEFIEEIENPPPRSRWKTRKVAKFKCDFCNKEILIRKNVKKKIMQKYIFCNKDCSTEARKNNGVLQQQSKQVNLEKYGVEHFSQREDVKRKRKKTFIEKYGVENPSKLDSIKEKKRKTSLKNWGVDYPNKSKAVRKKTEKTNLKKYGSTNPMRNAEIQKKVIKTNLENYGVENPFQSEKIKEKIKQTCLKNYGVEHNSQTEAYKKSFKETNQKKWGVDHFWEAEEIRKKIKETNFKRYGCEFPTQNKTIKDNTVKTNIKKYGVNYPTQNKCIKNKIRETLLKRYGTINSWRTPYKNIIETGQSLAEWYSELPAPKPGYVIFCRAFTKKDISVFELKEFINNYDPNKTQLEALAENLFDIKHYNKSPKQISSMCRPDFKLNNTTYLNVDGLYWHSELRKDEKCYHYTLREDFEKANLRLFQIREDEICNRPDIIKSIINNTLGKTQDKIYARKCEIRKIKHKEAIKFLNQNHLMGSTNAKHLGLFYNNELVSILSWKCRKDVCKIERFCSKVNTSVVGGFSKLLSHLEKYCLSSKIDQIHNWVDLRYGTGDHLSNKGFVFKKETLGWKWTDFYNTFNRLQCRANMDERKLSMREHANELGWVKIYDAGQRLWVKKCFKK